MCLTLAAVNAEMLTFLFRKLHKDVEALKHKD